MQFKLFSILVLSTLTEAGQIFVRKSKAAAAPVLDNAAVFARDVPEVVSAESAARAPADVPAPAAPAFEAADPAVVAHHVPDAARAPAPDIRTAIEIGKQQELEYAAVAMFLEKRGNENIFLNEREKVKVAELREKVKVAETKVEESTARLNSALADLGLLPERLATEKRRKDALYENIHNPKIMRAWMRKQMALSDLADEKNNLVKLVNGHKLKDH